MVSLFYLRSTTVGTWWEGGGVDHSAGVQEQKDTLDTLVRISRNSGGVFRLQICTKGRGMIGYSNILNI